MDDFVAYDEYTGEEMGWVRCPEKDAATYDAWEKPDGSLIAVPRGHTPRVAKVRYALLKGLGRD